MDFTTFLFIAILIALAAFLTGQTPWQRRKAKGFAATTVLNAAVAKLIEVSPCRQQVIDDLREMKRRAIVERLPNASALVEAFASFESTLATDSSLESSESVDLDTLLGMYMEIMAGLDVIIEALKAILWVHPNKTELAQKARAMRLVLEMGINARLPGA